MDSITAAILLVIGLVAAALADVIIKHIAKMSVYRWSKRINPPFHRRVVKIVNVTALIVSAIIFLFFLTQSLASLELLEMSKLLETASVQLSPLVLAGVILIVGIVIAKIVAIEIENIDVPHGKFVAHAVELLIITATILTALENIGLKLTAFTELYRAAVWGATITIAIILGVSLGIIMKPKIAKMLKEKK